MTARAGRKDTRLRGRALERIRRAHFMAHPLCVMCLKKDPPVVSLAVELDHIVALENGGLDFDKDQGKNRQGLCVECHKVKTALDMGYKAVVRIGVDGFPIGNGSTGGEVVSNPLPKRKPAA